ncbi:hypothetical protein HUN41_00029 [Streptomyces phage Coruscant]|uniref:Uncharacterized protein n=1 Tax=Streptomyces phage Coruscant TaxID=2739834 RepID=A0A7G4AVW9_9CAUD|nr:hypothetical protein PP454_gp029 [Streptomyces phage Coruscant]QMP84159.1 hypothetical protein HUN41_00029 [Streptomyces phage Coruscant]
MSDVTQTTNAQRWAQEFINIIKDRPAMALDEGFMIGWFANAIEAGVRKGQNDKD